MAKRIRKSYDPTRTTLLRRKFLLDINRRLKSILVDLKQMLLVDDMLGLKQGTAKPLTALQQGPSYVFTTDAQRLRAFRDWIKQQVDAKILVVSGRGTPGQPWTYEYVETAYKKGIDRAYIDTNKEALAKSPVWYAGTRQQFLKTALMLPTFMSKLELLSLRTYDQLQGITYAMSQQMSRVLAEGLAAGMNPLRIATQLTRTVQGLSRNRARTIARTEIIYAHAEGQLDSFELLGVDELGLLVEWSTAGDDLVCTKCNSKAGNTYTIEQARGMIPLHPNCLSRDTEVYTSDGFVKIGEVDRGKKCLSLNPKTFNLDYVPVVATVAQKSKNLLHFKSHNFDLMVTPEHNMFAKRRERPWTNKREWEFIQAKDISNETAFYRSSEWRGCKDSWLWIVDQEITSELFCEFMGWWLSEGCFGNKRIVINQDREVHPDKYERICEVAESLSRNGKVWRGKEKVYFENDGLRRYLERFGKSHQKYIPDDIKQLKPQYLRIFLDAYAAGDGYVRKSRQSRIKGGGTFREEIVYATSSKRMADDLGELLIKVGRRPSYTLVNTKGKSLEFSNGTYVTNHDMWIVRECYAKVSRVNSKTGIRITKVKYEDYAYCLQLAKWHTLLVRRNGKVTWTGNCRCAWKPSTERTRREGRRSK